MLSSTVTVDNTSIPHSQTRTINILASTRSGHTCTCSA